MTVGVRRGEVVLTRAGAGVGAGGRSVDADPVTTEIVRQALNSAAEQMKRALVRTAFSPIIYEVLDFAVALYDRRIRLLAQAPSLPIFMGTMGFCVEAAVTAVGGEEVLEPGDILLYNIPYGSGTHPQDAAMVMPCFLPAGQLVGYATCKAHWADIGAKSPYCTDTVDVHQEGTLFPGVKLFQRGELVADVHRIVLANSRVPKMVAGDLSAEVVAVRRGADELVRIVERNGLQSFEESVERMFDHGEAIVRSYFEGIPDGRYSAFGEMDDNGVSDEPLPFEVVVEVEGSSVRIDYSRAPDAQPGPVNCPLPDTVSASRIAITMLAAHNEPPNEGHLRPIEVLTRAGSLFHPLPPSPCFLCGWATLQAIEVIYHALADAMPTAVPAGSGCDLLYLDWSGIREQTGEPWVDGFVHPVGQGAHHAGDGASSLMQVSEASARTPPVEVSEARNPWVFERVELAQDSGGPGRHRGGLGVDLTMRTREPAVLTTVIERTRNPPWGLAGGLVGRANSATLTLPDGATRALTKLTRIDVPAGSVVEVHSGGGGGYGPCAEREVEAVLHDVRQGYVSEAQAKARYPHAFAPAGVPASP